MYAVVVSHVPGALDLDQSHITKRNHCQLVSHNRKYLVFQNQIVLYIPKAPLFQPIASSKYWLFTFSQISVFDKNNRPSESLGNSRSWPRKVPPCHSADFHQSVFSRKIKTTLPYFGNPLSLDLRLQLRGVDFWMICSRTLEIYLRVSTFLTETGRAARGFMGILGDQGWRKARSIGDSFVKNAMSLPPLSLEHDG